MIGIDVGRQSDDFGAVKYAFTGDYKAPCPRNKGIKILTIMSPYGIHELEKFYSIAQDLQRIEKKYGVSPLTKLLKDRTSLVFGTPKHFIDPYHDENRDRHLFEQEFICKFSKEKTDEN